MYQGKIFEMCTTFKPLFKHSIILKSRLKKIYFFLFIVQYLPISRIKNLLRQVNKSHCEKRERIESILEQQKIQLY